MKKTSGTKWSHRTGNDNGTVLIENSRYWFVFYREDGFGITGGAKSGIQATDSNFNAAQESAWTYGKAEGLWY